MINENLQSALELLDYQLTTVINSRDEEHELSLEDQAAALFSVFHVAGFLDQASLAQAVHCLAVDRPFAQPPSVVFQDLCYAVALATDEGNFNSQVFLENFCNQDYLSVTDCVEIISFLQQTAFDRKFGEERDQLEAKPWMETHWQDFFAWSETLGLVAQQTSEAHCDAIAIMGAASFRLSERIQTFIDLADERKNAAEVYLLTSSRREVSLGLDEEHIIRATADFFEIDFLEPPFIDKPVSPNSKTTRQYPNTNEPITEKMMAEYLIWTLTGKDIRNNMQVSDAAVPEDHWRGNTASSAEDFANKFHQKFAHSSEIDGLTVMVIAEQPFTARMARQVQRELNKQFDASPIAINVIGEGKSLPSQVALSEMEINDVVAIAKRVHSSMAANMAERYNDCRQKLTNPRDPNSFMFSKRKQHVADTIERRCEEIRERIDLAGSGGSSGDTLSPEERSQQLEVVKTLVSEEPDSWDIPTLVEHMQSLRLDEELITLVVAIQQPVPPEVSVSAIYARP